MNKKTVGCGLFLVIFLLTLVVSPILAQKRITLTGTFAAPKARWDFLLPLAEKEFEKENPGIDLVLDYEVLPYNEMRMKLITMLTAKTPNDLISVTGTWYPEFIEGGFLRDISEDIEAWGRIDEFYEFARKMTLYKGRYYGLQAWSDCRLMWYWKDMLAEAGVKPEDLMTWGTYIQAARKLNDYWQPKGVEGVLLIGDYWRVHWWFPYLWMLKGNLTQKVKLPEYEGIYPAFHGTSGVTALQFIVDQVNAGITPLVGHRWGERFGARKYVVWLGGVWAIGKVPGWEEEREVVRRQVGLIPMFPVPTLGISTSTAVSGWILSIPTTSKHPDTAWEFLKTLLEPKIISGVTQYGYLPAQITIAEKDPYKSQLEDYWGIDWWEKIAPLLPLGHPLKATFPEYMEMENSISIAIEKAYRKMKSPKEALTEAARKTCEVLEIPKEYWPEVDWPDWYPPNVPVAIIK